MHFDTACRANYYYNDMKRAIDRLERLVIYLVSLTMRVFLPIRKGRVLLWATIGKDYGCNPMYISKYLVSNEKYFDVWWMFLKGRNVDQLNANEKVVWYGSLKYLYVLNTAEFLITNHRTDSKYFFWMKKKGQKYIMTWHGSMPIKKVEKDAIESVGAEYVSMAKTDSLNCDLMLSDSEFFTNLLRKSFWYDGEILKTTLPRNQKFYEKGNNQTIRNIVLNFYGEKVDAEYYIILYAPTFRQNCSVDSYITKWEELKNVIESKYGKKAIILVRLHPNLLKVVDTNTLITEDYVKNASIYNDMQELMVAADMLITDYSSTMFEFSMMRKPCFLYMPDRDTYDRGFYFNLSELPFAQSETISALISYIENCESSVYLEKSYAFVNTRFGLYEQCNGSAKVCDWMNRHSI